MTVIFLLSNMHFYEGAENVNSKSACQPTLSLHSRWKL